MYSLTHGPVWRGATETDMIRAFAAVVRDLGEFQQDAPQAR
ncbi:hypothetical protein [Streptomyces sp. NBC_01268]|nr:hypothetical protein [Streptomyces sp. NBC_01268]